MTDSEESGMVSLPGPGRFQVPGRFTVALYRRVRDSRVDAEATVEMIDGEPYLRAVTVEVSDPEARPLSAADLRSYFSLVEVLDAAVQRAAQLHTRREWAWEPEDDNPVPLKSLLGWTGEQAAADEHAALAAARATHDRRRVTPDRLRQVLDIHAAKGIEGVMDEMHYSERNARRLLARARKELA